MLADARPISADLLRIQSNQTEPNWRKSASGQAALGLVYLRVQSVLGKLTSMAVVVVGATAATAAVVLGVLARFGTGMI